MLWTLAWQEGTGGEAVAARLAEAEDLPLVGDESIGLTHVPGHLEALCHTLARTNSFSSAALRSLPTPEELRAARERATREAAGCAAVVTAWGGAVVLADRPGAVHAYLRAPEDWRVARYARERLVSAERARRKVREADHRRASFLHRLYGVDADDPAGYGVVLDVSRLGDDAVLTALRAAAGEEVAPWVV